MITVFTATHNRASLLKRLYESLKRQTCKEFEWIIVDDCSSDNTEEVALSFRDEQDFPVRYTRRMENGGKHRCINQGVKLATGEWFFIVDDDDYLTDDAIELVCLWTESIADNHMICGVSGLKMHSDGRCIGNFTDEVVDASNIERWKYNLEGDKAEVYKTDLIRSHPLPEFPGESFVTEAVYGDAIAYEGYKLRWFNKVIYMCEYLDDGLTNSGANSIEGHKKNWRGYCYYVRQSIKVRSLIEAMPFFRSYDLVRRELNRSLNDSANDLGISKFNYVNNLLLMYPLLILRKITHFYFFRCK